MDKKRASQSQPLKNSQANNTPKISPLQRFNEAIERFKAEVPNHSEAQLLQACQMLAKQVGLPLLTLKSNDPALRPVKAMAARRGLKLRVANCPKVTARRGGYYAIFRGDALLCASNDLSQLIEVVENCEVTL